MARVEAIVLSMTPHERRVPHLINGPRRRRIAAGSGTSIDEVNKLLAARKQMQKMMKQFGKGKLPTLPPELTGGKPRAMIGTIPVRENDNRKRTKEKNGCSYEIDTDRIEEEPDLPCGRGRLALAA